MRFKELYEQETLLEYSAKELSDMSDAARKRRMKKITKAEYKESTQTKDNHLKTIWNTPSATHKKKVYEQVVEVIPKESNAFSLVANNKWNLKEFTDVVKNADLRVYCDCPDFLFGGQKFNLGNLGDYRGSLAKGNIGDFFPGDKADVTIEPNVKDPEREHVLCKHLLKVSQVFAANTSSMLAHAKKLQFVKHK